MKPTRNRYITPLSNGLLAEETFELIVADVCLRSCEQDQATIEIYVVDRDAIGLIMLIAVEFPAGEFIPFSMLPCAREKHYPKR